MAELHIELIDRLREASAALSASVHVIGDCFGSDDELFDLVVQASETAGRAADRLEGRADTYGEMVHLGI
jgi:hypothetical protein